MNLHRLIHCRSFSSRWTGQSYWPVRLFHTSCTQLYLRAASSPECWLYHRNHTCLPSSPSTLGTSDSYALLSQQEAFTLSTPRSIALTVTQRTYLQSLSVPAWLAFLLGYFSYYLFCCPNAIRSVLASLIPWCLAWLFFWLWLSLWLEATGMPSHL